MIGPKPKGLTRCGCGSPWQTIKEQIQALYERVTVTEQRCNTLQAEIDEIEVGPGDHILRIIEVDYSVPGDTTCIWDGEETTLEAIAGYIYNAVYRNLKEITLIVPDMNDAKTMRYYRIGNVIDSRATLLSTQITFNRVYVIGKTSVTEEAWNLIIEGGDLSLKHVTGFLLGANTYP